MERSVEDIKVSPEEFPPNNGTKREPIHLKTEPITPKAKRKQTTIRNAIFASEITDMKQFLIYDCLIPFTKNALMNTLSMMLFNKPWSNSPGTVSSNRPRNTGSTYWGGVNSGPMRDISKDFLFETKAEALDVAEGLAQWSERAGVTTIADLCRIAGLTPEPGDADYGWFTLRNLRVQTYGNNFYIELPRVRPLS